MIIIIRSVTLTGNVPTAHQRTLKLINLTNDLDSLGELKEHHRKTNHGLSYCSGCTEVFSDAELQNLIRHNLEVHGHEDNSHRQCFTASMFSSRERQDVAFVVVWALL